MMFQPLPNSGRITFKTSAGTVITSAPARWGPLLSTYAGVEVDAGDVKNTALFVCRGFSQRWLATKIVKQSHYIWINSSESYLITGLKDFGSHTEFVGLRQNVPVGFIDSTAGGIISEWAFRSSSELLTDEQALNTLTNFGTVTYNSDIPSQLSSECGSAVLNGSNDLEIADGSQSRLDITGSICVACRVKFTTLTGTQGIICKGNGATQRGYYLYKNTSHKLAFEISSDGTVETTASGATAMVANTWYSVVGVYDGSTIKVYVNGAVDGSVSYTAGGFNNTTKFTLGVRGDDTQFMTGRMAHVLICNQSKTAAQIAAWHSTDILE